MRKGSSSLGTDVPSESEINRLAARSHEEFVIFEAMDNEMKMKDKYRSRLMQEHEVPEWAYSAPDTNKEGKGKGFNPDSTVVLGKRRRKEVTYADTLSDLQWMKAVENGQEVSRSSTKGRKRENWPSQGNEPTRNSAGTERLLDTRNENLPAASEGASEGTSEDTVISTPNNLKFDEAVPLKPEYPSVEKPEHRDSRESGWNGLAFAWNTHKKKRSSYAIHGSSSDFRGQSYNGRGNGRN